MYSTKKPTWAATNCSEFSISVKVTQPGVGYFTVASVHSFQEKKRKGLFQAHRQRAVGSCQTEVANYARRLGLNIKKVTAFAQIQKLCKVFTFEEFFAVA